MGGGELLSLRDAALDDFVYDPIHYLPLLEKKTGALDQAAPLQGWALPEEFGTLRRLLESRNSTPARCRPSITCSPWVSPLESRSMWVTTRVSPSTTRSSSSKRPPRSFLAPLASFGSDISQGAAGADQPLHLQVQILVLRLSHRDPGVTVERHPAAPLAGMGKSIPSCRGEINRVFQPPPELRQGGIPSRGRKQGCFQPCTPGAGGLTKLGEYIRAERSKGVSQRELT